VRIRIILKHSIDHTNDRSTPSGISTLNLMPISGVDTVAFVRCLDIAHEGQLERKQAGPKVFHYPSCYLFHVFMYCTKPSHVSDNFVSRLQQCLVHPSASTRSIVQMHALCRCHCDVQIPRGKRPLVTARATLEDKNPSRQCCLKQHDNEQFTCKFRRSNRHAAGT
jgi:hypothetical protein